MSQKILKWEFPLTECIRILLRSLVMGLVIWLGIIWLGNSLIALFLILMIAGFIYGLLDFFDNKDSSFFSIINIRKIYRDNIKY